MYVQSRLICTHLEKTSLRKRRHRSLRNRRDTLNTAEIFYGQIERKDIIDETTLERFEFDASVVPQLDKRTAGKP